MIKKSTLTPILTSVAGVIFILLLHFSGILDTIEARTVDLRFHLANQTTQADTNVVLVAIDQKSISFFQEQGVLWPWPREFYAGLVNYLSAGGAAAIGFDIEFAQPDFERLNIDAAQSDDAFALAIYQAGNVVLASQLQRDSTEAVGFLPENSKHLLTSGLPVNWEGVTVPISVFQDATARLGIVNFQTDADGIARRIPPAFALPGKGALPQFGVACYGLANGLDNDSLAAIIDGLPVEEDGRLWMNWYGKGGPGGVFKYYSIASLIVSSYKLSLDIEPDVDPNLFKGKTVIIGASAAGLLDFKPTPFTATELYPGMEIHATVVSNLMHNDWLTEVPSWVLILVLIGLSAGVTLSVYKSEKNSRIVGAVLLISLGYFGLVLFLFGSEHQIWPVTPAAITIMIAFASAASLKYAAEGRQKRAIRQVFNRYLSPDVINEIMQDPSTLTLGGDEIVATAFFSDIENFTNISEKMTPAEVVNSLNQYLGQVVNVLVKSNAMLDKFLGDGVMAIWGAPKPNDNHARLACLACLEIQTALAAFYRRPENAHLPPFITRMGLHSGKMVVGNIGTEMRSEYTAIGDTVNLSARLESANKQYGTRILISEETLALAGDGFVVRELDLLQVKGRDHPTRVYTILGLEGEVEAELLRANQPFKEGVDLYRKRQWQGAIASFKAVLLIQPKDKAAQLYIDRAEILSQNPPPADWNGVYISITK